MLSLRIKDFEIALSYPFTALCALVLISGRHTAYLYCVIAVVIHEAGHLAAMRFFKVRASGVVISLFNIIIREENRFNVKPLQDFIITLFGPLFNIFAFAVFLPFGDVFAIVNLLLGEFNLLPAAGLDGGQLLYLVLIRLTSPRGAALAVDIITFILSIPLFAAGILILLQSKYNFSLLFLSLYLILNVFLKEGKYV